MPVTIFSSPLEFGITCGILVIAQLVYVLFGFGSGLIAVGSLALIFPEIKDVVVLLLLVNLPAELFVTWRSRKEIHWRPIGGLGVGIAVGIPLGAWLLSTTEPDLILTILGWFLIAVGLQTFTYFAYLGAVHGGLDGLLESGLYGDIPREEMTRLIFVYTAALKLMSTAILMAALFLTLWVRGLRRLG